MKMQTLQDLFLDELRELYDAEKQLIKAWPKVANAASSHQLRAAFESQSRETEEHIARLERVFDQLAKNAIPNSCDAMRGLIKEADKVGAKMDESPLRDAGLIGAAERIKRYEMAAYGAALTFAEMLGCGEAAHLLEQTLHEEKLADRRLGELELTELAEQMISETTAHKRSQGRQVSVSAEVALSAS